MKIQLILLALLLILFSTRGNDGPALPEGSKQETVVLLHGLVRSDQAMKKMVKERLLQKDGSDYRLTQRGSNFLYR